MRSRKKESLVSVRYETDRVACANEQARLMRAGRFDVLDIEHIAEEIEDVGKSEQRERANRMAVFLAHLLKWQYQPDRQGSRWQTTISVQRKTLLRRLTNTPSLKASLNDNDWWADAWADARTVASNETGLGFDVFPDECPWAADEVSNSEWLPS